MSLVVEAVNVKSTGVMVLDAQESELFLDLYEQKNNGIVHDVETLFYYTPIELMVMVDRKVYNDYTKRRNGNDLQEGV